VCLQFIIAKCILLIGNTCDFTSKNVETEVMLSSSSAYRWMGDDFSRVKLRKLPGEEGSDYINASYIDVNHHLIMVLNLVH